jgi:mRNA-degrading endonuclease RelE of RelBE toxin-antitoxin system
VSTEPERRYEIRFQPAAPRAIAERLPEPVATAVLEFCEAALAVNPHRVGKSLFGPLAGCHGARRGTYRIVYRIDETTSTVHVLDIDHRARIYRPHALGVAFMHRGTEGQACPDVPGVQLLPMDLEVAVPYSAPNTRLVG